MIHLRLFFLIAAVLAAVPLAAGGPATPVAVELPADDRLFDGPDADLLNANCAACHDAAMVMVQPPMTAAQWSATVAKMRSVYKAPVEDGDVPRLVTALAALKRE
ncbi:cytochrome c [Sphingomonas changnyeongensis]|uniref:Cytochrome c n=1 Tax=Sphingomonas changnyeongensis TaxID=2698679 RepID=A0A7Z2S997_9SPHN|nr:cytochrome c [Sphingomonas changnyeongensis]QHL91527.1 cytochrome c [Sphingomonas changnyeongensis]